MTIALASGKGGAGKTTLAAAIATTTRQPCIVADCDVDAANVAIALGARLREEVPYFAGPGFQIVESACSRCGECAKACRFNAIAFDQKVLRYSIIPELCERCGACMDHCPDKAIDMYEKEAGRLLVSETQKGMMLVHAELVPGEDTSGKLVRKVRERATALALGSADIVVDAPPGIGCPVIASLSGSDLVVIVVEASSSGIRDAERLIMLVDSMKRKAVAVLNKVGLDTSMDARARTLVSSMGIPLAGEIPFDPTLRSMEEAGKTWADAEGETGLAVRMVLGALHSVIASISSKSKGYVP